MAVFAIPITWAVFTLLATSTRLTFAWPPLAHEERQASKCTKSTFASALPAGASIERVDSVRQGGGYGEGTADLGFPKNATNLPALCAVTVRFANATSSFRFGLFLPAAASWNSQFLAVGSYSFAGGINWPDMAQGPHYGMATVSTDNGHNSTQDSLDWNTPEMLADWGYRAVHGSVLMGKQLTEAYYGSKIKYSYYSGCSTGGRQGLKEIQISPDSFDGVLVGAPAWYTSHFMPWVTKIGALNLPTDAAGHIDVAQFATLSAAALQQCDHLDGHNDSIISLPEQCRLKLDLTEVLCADPNNPSGCLLREQIETALGIYNDSYTAAGEFVHNGFNVGSEDQWYVYLAYGDEEDFDTRYERYWLYDDPSWNWTMYSDQVFYDSVRMNPGNATADAYDIGAFRDAGGKVLMYHGLADALVPTRGSLLYYARTASALSGGGGGGGGGDADVAALRSFFRYFEVPGMQHCFGTPAAVNAPWMFAGAGQATLLLQDYNFGQGWGVPGQPASAAHDALLALVDWVEKGDAPESIVATVWNGDGSVNRTRPICPYPEAATYKGPGSEDSAANWSCQ